MKELGVAELTREQAMIVAEAACAPDDTMCNMPFEVTPEMVANAILGADALGHYYLMDEVNLGKEGAKASRWLCPFLLWCKGVRLVEPKKAG